MKKDIFKVSNQVLKSRLIVGTGKYKNFKETAQAIKASGADMVTVAVRRVNILDKKKPLLTDYLDPKKIKYLPNTAGCFNSEEALRTLYPDMIETLKATKVLVNEGFRVLVYCSDDPLLAKELEYLGASAVMPLASPIGSGQGIQNKINLSLIIKKLKVPVIIDAGIGTASDATIAMEMGCDGVLVNSAIAKARNPILMAESFKNAVISGRQSYISIRMKKLYYGKASSPSKGLI